MTIFSPAATHFFVQASPAALAPFAPHLASTIHPLTVALLPMSSNAIADRASTKHTARQLSNTFLMAGILLLKIPFAGPKPQAPRNCRPPSRGARSQVDREMRRRHYTIERTRDCQRDSESELRGSANKNAL